MHEDLGAIETSKSSYGICLSIPVTAARRRGVVGRDPPSHRLRASLQKKLKPRRTV